MIKKISKYWNVFLIIIILIIIMYFIYFFIIGGIAMDKGVGQFHYSTSLQEAKKENTIIKKYYLTNSNHKIISNGWLEYARTYDISHTKTIEKDRILLTVKQTKEFDEIKNVYWEAFFKNQKLTSFEGKGIISIVGVDKNMDTIILKANKNDFFYIISEK